MKSHLIPLTCLFILLVSSPVFAQNTSQMADPVVLQDGHDEYPIGRFLEILRDPGGQLTFQEVSSAAYQDQFSLSQDEIPNFGYQSAVYWVRFRIISQFEQTSRWVLELGFPNMHYMDIYLPSPDGTSYSEKKSGAMRPYKSRDFPFHHLAYNLDIPPGSEQTIYLRFQSQASMTLPLKIWSSDAFNRVMLSEQLILGLFYGILTVMALYNLFLWILIRERSYLYLVLFILSWTAFYYFYDALPLWFLQSISSRLVTAGTLILLGFSIFFIIKFVAELLDLKVYMPAVHRWSNYFAGLMILTVFIAPFVAYKHLIVIQLILGIFLFLTILGLSLYLWRVGNRPARYLLISWTLFLLGGILAAFARMGILPSTVFTEELLRFGMIWMVAVWSLALADQVNTLKAESEITNRQLSESESRLNQFLEAMPVGVVVYGDDYKPLYINKKTQLMLTNPTRNIFPEIGAQRSLTEMLAYFSIRVFGTEQPYPMEQFPIMQALKGKAASADDVEIDLKDHRLPIEIWASPLFDSDQHVTGTIAVFQDITERKRVEKALLESEESYRKLVETMKEGLGVLDENNIITYVNPRLGELLGYASEEIIGRPIEEFFDEDNRSTIANQLIRRRLGEEQSYEITWRRKDGSRLHTLIAPAVVFSSNGNFQRSIAVVTDIGEQVKSSQLLEQRVAERTHELGILLEISQLVAGSLELEPLLKVILEQLKSVVDFTGAAILTLEDHRLVTMDFELQIAQDLTDESIRSILQVLLSSERVLNDETFIVQDIQADSREGRGFREVFTNHFDVLVDDIRSWLGVPLKVKENLIGFLSIHHCQPNYYTPEKAQLAHAFANQAALAIENTHLYKQAQAAAAAEERSRLARELHDTVTQELYSLMLYADACRLALRSGKTEAAERNLSEVLAIAREGMSDLRLLIFELRPPVLEEEGLVGALIARLEAVEARASCQTEFHVQGDPELSSNEEDELYWVVTEVLNNILKHSRARHVYLDMDFQSSKSTITIRDDGVGFDSTNIDRFSGMGFKNIIERINRIGGSYTIESEPDKGTVFQVRLAPSV